MANIINHNFHNLKLRINYDEYWDLFVNLDTYESGYHFKHNQLCDKCLISFIDVSLYDCVFENEINSIEDYRWAHCIANNNVLHNIGYTGFDNGLLGFRKDKIGNEQFTKLFQNSTYEIKQECALVLHQVSGSTQVYDYPITVNDFDVKLNGGFYQGFFKTTCQDYQVLPSTLGEGDTWGLEFVLKPFNHIEESQHTLNHKYPNNKGIFFYIGTRAENKWVYLYDNDVDDSAEISLSDYVEGCEIDVKTHGIDAFLDMSITLPVEEESVAYDDYISYDYYKMINNETDDIFDVDWEEHNNIKMEYDSTIDWCCGVETITTAITKNWCGCGETSPTVVEKKSYAKRYYTKCEIFGDDYLEDINDMEYIVDFIADEMDISQFVYETTGGFTMGKNQYFIDTDNKFLLFNRTCDGFNTQNWTEDATHRYIGERSSFKGNLFLYMNRTCTGYNVNTISELKEQYKEKYDILKDLYQNALAFRITDNGEIGYKYFVQSCDNESGYEVKEAYSKPNIIKYNEWSVIHVKIEAKINTMILKFYVNGNLVFVSAELPKLELRELQELKDKQETVPYNISLGGGTQGLCDVILPNYMIKPYRVYPLEKHFGGTFIGYFKSFKFYECSLEHMDIQQNFKYEQKKLK